MAKVEHTSYARVLVGIDISAVRPHDTGLERMAAH